MILSQHLSLFNMKCLLEVHDKGAGSQSLFFFLELSKKFMRKRKKKARQPEIQVSFKYLFTYFTLHVVRVNKKIF